jgi:hypothetical protein
MDFIRAKFKSIGQVIDADVKHKQILKVVGQNEYMLHKSFPLYMYDCFARSIRLKVHKLYPIILLIVILILLIPI